jgi:hypothetical protein
MYPFKSHAIRTATKAETTPTTIQLFEPEAEPAIPPKAPEIPETISNLYLVFIFYNKKRTIKIFIYSLQLRT